MSIYIKFKITSKAIGNMYFFFAQQFLELKIQSIQIKNNNNNNKNNKLYILAK